MLHEIAPKKLDIMYRPEVISEADTILFVRAGEILLKGTEPLSFPSYAEYLSLRLLPESMAEITYLFAIDDTRYFTVRYDESGADAAFEPMKEKAESAGLSFLPTRFLRGKGPKDAVYAGMLAGQIYGWYERTRYCGRCGSPLQHDGKERMMRCKKCGNMIFPQICPSVIIGVLHEGKLLVTQYNPTHLMFDGTGKTFKPTVHEALVAGYVESGESAEECVAREVMEEVGLKVKNIRYYRSSPWPLSGALLLAYLCDVDGDPTVKVEEAELSKAVWKRPEEIEESYEGAFSMTRTIMEDFRDGKIR